MMALTFLRAAWERNRVIEAQNIAADGSPFLNASDPHREMCWRVVNAAHGGSLPRAVELVALPTLLSQEVVDHHRFLSDPRGKTSSTLMASFVGPQKAQMFTCVLCDGVCESWALGLLAAITR